MKEKTVLVIAETDGSNPKPVTSELASSGRYIDSKKGDGVLILVIGTSPDGAAKKTEAETGLDVLSLTITGPEFITGDIRKKAIIHAVETYKPRFILCPHTTEGCDYAPGLSVKLGAACISSVNRIVSDGSGGFLFSRSICGGQFDAILKTEKKQAVVMVQPGTVQIQGKPEEKGEIIRETLEIKNDGLKMTGVEKSRESSSKLGQASVIVAAGRGIGTMENLATIRRFAALFPNSAVAGSRPLIDMGWLEYRYQVGITGATVSPPVYIACGISGSSQHIAGMKGSGFVISINKDPNAAIFNYSDICIVDDITGFIEAFEAHIKDE